MKVLKNLSLFVILLFVISCQEEIDEQYDKIPEEEIQEHSQEIFKPEIVKREKKEINYTFLGTSKVEKILVEEVEGFLIFEGDIIIGKSDTYNKDAGRPGQSFRWNRGEIPYEIEANHPNRDDILNAIGIINQSTVLCLSPRYNENDFVRFKFGGGCSSRVGRQKGQQNISITNCSIGSIQHEILHAAGMYHEQSRSDRDDFVRINYDNITRGREHNFDKVENTISICEYDFGSIMHYPSHAFTKNGLPTIEPIVDIPDGATMGQRRALSNCDVKGLSNLYPNASNCIPVWHSLGGKVTNNPKVVSWGPNRLNVFARGNNGSIYHKSWNGSKWSSYWENLGGNISEDAEIAAVSWGPNRIDLFVRGRDNSLYHNWWNGNSWSSYWENLGGNFQSNPKVISTKYNSLNVFVKGNNGSVYHKWWDGNNWSSYWENLGGQVDLNSKISAVSWDSARIDLFIKSNNKSLHHKWWNGSKWSNGWMDLGGSFTSSPKAVSWGVNRLDVFVRGNNGSVYHKWWNGSNWSNYWGNLGGNIPVDSEISAVCWGKSRIDVFVKGWDKSLYHKWSNGSGWSRNWDNLGGSLPLSFDVISWAPNRIDIFAKGQDNAVWQMFWNGRKWGK